MSAQQRWTWANVFALVLSSIVRVPFLLSQAGAAQTPPTLDAAAIRTAAATITADDIRRVVEMLAHDSMQGRELGSRELERTAAYVAHELSRFGIEPQAGVLSKTDTAWAQRYTIPGTFTPSYSKSSLAFIGGLYRRGRALIAEDGNPMGFRTDVAFANAARFVTDTISESDALGQVLWRTRPLVLLTGRHTAATVGQAHLDEDVVMYLPPAGTDSVTFREVVAALKRTSNVVVLADEDSIAFAHGRNANEARPPVVINNFMDATSGNRHWAASVWLGAMKSSLDRMGLDVPEMRADHAPAIRSVPLTGVSLAMSTEPTESTGTGMNVVGILWGTDKVTTPFRPIPVNNQLVVISAHMDTGDRGARGANGAYDDASGVAGLLALAKAFSQPGVRPRRSILFVATTGITHGAAGANFAAANDQLSGGAMLNLTLNMIGGPPNDSVVIDGLRDLDFERPPEWQAALHDELGIAVVDGGSIFTRRSDHIAFVARAIPSLLIRAGAHDASASATPNAHKSKAVDAELTARRLRLIFYIAHDIASGVRRPSWTKEARARRIEAFGE